MGGEDAREVDSDEGVVVVVIIVVAAAPEVSCDDDDDVGRGSDGIGSRKIPGAACWQWFTQIDTGHVSGVEEQQRKET